MKDKVLDKVLIDKTGTVIKDKWRDGFTGISTETVVIETIGIELEV